METEHTNFRLMSREVEKIAFIYNKYKAHQKLNILHEDVDDYQKKAADNENFIQLIDAALSNLYEEEKDLLMNEYFERSSYRFWWLSFYSRSSFYRIKRQALEKFLDFVQ